MHAPVVREQGRKRAAAEARERQRNNELALAVARKVAEHGAVEVEMPQREPLSIVQLGAMVRAARRDRLTRVTGG